MKRDSTIDIGRSICMLYIIGVWHLSGYSDVFNVGHWGEFVKNSALGMFMFASGYLLAKKYLIANLNELTEFLKKRVVRIIPLFAASMFLLVVTGGGYPIGKGLLSLIGLTSFATPQPLTLWFVSMIILFYYLFTIINREKISLTILYSVIITTVFALLMLADAPIDRRLLYYFPCFAMGVILKRYSVVNITSPIVFALSLLMFSLFVSIEFLNINFGIKVLAKVGISFSGALLLLFLSRMLSNSKVVCKLASLVSYAGLSAYLFHRAILAAISRYIYWPADGTWRVIFLIFVCVPTIMLLGYLIQWVYDMIIKRLKFL